MSIPNLITLARILLVPVVVWAITSDADAASRSCLFLAAGVSDAVDGFLAKRFGMATELGAYLDPLADKAHDRLDLCGARHRRRASRCWLVILVVSRDIMIVSAVMLSWLVDKPVKLKPHPVSKLNTVGADRARARSCWPRSASNSARMRRSDGADGAGRGLDLAFGCLLSRRMGPAHERARAPVLTGHRLGCRRDDR